MLKNCVTAHYEHYAHDEWSIGDPKYKGTMHIYNSLSDHE
jgi:hypothetical protein